MRLYLVQHGVALAKEVDPERGLSGQGKDDTRKTAEFLRKKNIKADIIWHSGKPRSLQTARIISEYLPGAEILERDDINPLDPVDKFPPEIQNLNAELMIVGHLPFLSRLVTKLLLDSDRIDLLSFQNSGVVCMEYTDTWRIKWAFTPELL